MKWAPPVDKLPKSEEREREHDYRTIREIMNDYRTARFLEQLASLDAEIATLRAHADTLAEALEAVGKYLSTGKWVKPNGVDNFIRAALAAYKEGK